MLDYKIILLGYSGHGFVVAEAAIESKLNLLFYADKIPSTINPYKLNYIGDEESEFFGGWESNNKFILGIGDNRIRKKVVNYIISKNYEVLNVIHPKSSISEYTKIGQGNFFARNCSISPLVDIGNYCIINTGAIIEHECILGNIVHIAPGVVLAGAVEVGDLSFIGANTVVKQGVKIGKNVIVGAGSVILKDIPDGKIIAGNPGKTLR